MQLQGSKLDEEQHFQGDVEFDEELQLQSDELGKELQLQGSKRFQGDKLDEELQLQGDERFYQELQLQSGKHEELGHQRQERKRKDFEHEKHECKERYIKDRKQEVLTSCGKKRRNFKLRRFFYTLQNKDRYALEVFCLKRDRLRRIRLRTGRSSSL